MHVLFFFQNFSKIACSFVEKRSLSRYNKKLKGDNLMSQKKIIKPEGEAIWKYLNDGYAICNECGALMDQTTDPETGYAVFKCPACGWQIEEEDYVYDDGDPEPREWTDQMKQAFGEDVPPAGCLACGGPYPYCKTSCKLFDE